VDTALVHFLGAVVALPFALAITLAFGLPQPQSWPFIGASVVIHIGYYIALAGAYQHGELGMTYPIMRGFAPLLVALYVTFGGGAFVGEHPSATAWLGTLGITAGVALVGLAHPGEALHHRKALAFAFANAAIIAIYTVVDGLGVRASGNAAAYVFVLFVLDGFPFPLLVWLRRTPQQRQDILAYARTRWPKAALGGAASIGSYAVALWAMTQAPVASVAALRETSVLFAALLGTWLLKEKFGWQRAAGTAVVVGGVMALRLG
jgi:drug/metabolite transporter (DMT)-like permease